jgi:PAS domain S-box-containing protein
MDTDLQHTLLQLFEHVSENPDSMPAVPVDAWQEGSMERQLLISFRNVLERLQQSRQDVQKSEERFALAVQGANDGLWDWDLRTDIVYFSPRWKSMLGYEDHEISHHFNEWLKRVHPDDLERAQETIQDYLNGRTATYRLEHRLQHKDGTYRWIVARGALLRDKDDKPYRMAGSHTDVTERKKAEEQLREKEAQYRSIFESTSDALLITDLEDGQVVEANPAACYIYGYSYEEFIGLPPSAFIHPDKLPYYMEKALPSVKAGVKWHTRGIDLRKDGTAFPVDVHETAFTYQGKPHMLAAIRDITEQVQAEEELREKEAQYRSIFEATSDVLLIIDLEDGSFVEVNPTACDVYGYSYEEFVGLPLSATIHPNDLPYVMEHVLPIIRAGGEYHARGIGLRKDGTTFHLDVHDTAFTYQGKLRMLAVIRDITKQVQAEEQLREKEEQYRSIFEATSDGLLINDLEDGHIVEANPAECRMHGCTYEECLNLPVTTLIHPDYHHLFEEYIQRVKAGGEFQARAVDLRKDGTPYPVEVRGTPFIYKGKPHALSVIRDITEQIRAEERLREKEEQYRSIFEATIDALFITDLEDGHIVEANPAACKIYGYSYDEFIGLPRSALIHPDRLSLFLEKALSSVKAGGEWHTRGVNLRKDGTAFPVDVHETPFTYQGKPHMLAVIRDITEQVQAEEQLRQKEAQYRSVFEASTDGLVINDLEDGHLVEVNPAMHRMHGYSYEEFMMLNPMNFIHPDSHPLFAEYIDTVKAGKKFQARAIDIHKDGTPFPVEVHGTAFDYKGKPHALAVVRDVTEQVQAYELLEQRVKERTRELSTLLDISHDVASTIELKPLLALVLEQLKKVADYTGSSFSILEGEDLVLVENRGPAPLDQVLQLHFPIKTMGIIWEMLSRREPVIIPDVQDDSLLAQAFRMWMGKRLKSPFGHIRAWMAIPLSHKEQVIGMLTLSSHEPDYYTPRHASLALAIANQAAVALANARLYEQAQELAALEERQRLARELHDSVSQALYGITLGTHTARTLLERDPSKVAEPLDYVLSQAEAALTEMRALIFELRPESLETEGLVAALSRQAAALRARNEIEVSTELCDEPDLPLKVKEELYRVAQEALHNTAKHARAKNVNLCMRLDTKGLLLKVCDDGVGFDATGSFPGHLGLHSMRERIARLGGTLQIESTPGQGTCIRAQLPTSTRRTAQLLL